jgi:putative ABC transport system ATP-binding protein
MTLRVEALSHTYPPPAPDAETRTVLQIDSWTLNTGDQVLLRGVSGSGKTTLFNILAGLLRPTSGAVYYDDYSLYELPEAARDRFRARQIGYVFQSHYLIGSLTAQENILMPMVFAGNVPKNAQTERANALLEQVGLSMVARHKPKQLSTGQRLRVALARALANNPRLVLADEPTAALDEANSANVIALLQKTCHENNAILIVASHDPAVAAQFTQRFDLRGGRLIEESTNNQPALVGMRDSASTAAIISPDDPVQDIDSGGRAVAHPQTIMS